MKIKSYRIFLIIIMTFGILLLWNSVSNAVATAGISASKTSVTQGEQVNINLSAQAVTCNLKVSRWWN